MPGANTPQSILEGALNYFTFTVPETASIPNDAALMMEFLHCGKTVKKLPVMVHSLCNCKLTVLTFIDCNAVPYADAIRLFLNSLLIAQSSVTPNLSK